MSALKETTLRVTNLHFIGLDEGWMVCCTLALDGMRYFCSEYVHEDGNVDDSADSHMTVNGILNLQAGRMEHFVVNDMDRDEYVRWTNTENAVRAAMQAFVTDKLFPSAAA